MLSITFLVCLFVVTCLFAQEPSHYNLSFPTGDNHLNIKVDTDDYSNNYFIIIGDWGASDEKDNFININSQKKVANMTQQYIDAQEKDGKTLLFFVSLGDNFYFTGTFYYII